MSDSLTSGATSRKRMRNSPSPKPSGSVSPGKEKSPIALGDESVRAPSTGLPRGEFHDFDDVILKFDSSFDDGDTDEMIRLLKGMANTYAFFSTTMISFIEKAVEEKKEKDDKIDVLINELNDLKARK